MGISITFFRLWLNYVPYVVQFVILQYITAGTILTGFAAFNKSWKYAFCLSCKGSSNIISISFIIILSIQFVIPSIPQYTFHTLLGNNTPHNLYIHLGRRGFLGCLLILIFPNLIIIIRFKAHIAPAYLCNLFRPWTLFLCLVSAFGLNKFCSHNVLILFSLGTRPVVVV